MKLKYLIIFTVTLLIGVVFAFDYLFSIRSPHPIAQNLIPLEITGENQGHRCEDRHWDGPSDNRLCYKLQEQLSEAVKKNDLDGIREALKQGANSNGSSYQSYKPLFTAAMLGKKEAALLLIENGANVNRGGDVWNTSPLQEAVIYHHNEITEILLENGADICHKSNWDISDMPNPTALDIAQKYENEGAAALLVSFGARRCF